MNQRLKPQRMHSVLLSGLILTGTILGGCTVGPDYRMPKLALPQGWLGTTGQPTLSEGEAPVGSLAWWQAFGDPTLDRLIQLALANNGDLKIALARVQEARGQRSSAGAALLPNVGFQASANRNAVNGAATQTRTLGVNAAWELDVFGGGRRNLEAARANAEAAEAARRAVRVSLLSDLAQTYLDVRRLQQQALLTERNLNTQQETLRIVRAQFREGVVDDFDVSRAEAQVATTAAQLPVVRQQLNASLNSMAVLTGQTPADIRTITGPAVPVPVATPEVLVATPATVLARRPDVRVTERNLATATANQGVAISNWFPRLSLTSLFGLQQARGGSRDDVFNVGGVVTMPLLDFGRVRALVNIADARQAAALADYEQTVRIALSDVETALSGYVNAQARLTELRTAAANQRRAVQLARARYQAGTTTLLDVLTAEQQQLATDSTLVAAEAGVGQTLADLYRALGGGAEE